MLAKKFYFKKLQQKIKNYDVCLGKNFVPSTMSSNTALTNTLNSIVEMHMVHAIFDMLVILEMKASLLPYLKI
jgi:hypothetical protein